LYRGNVPRDIVSTANIDGHEGLILVEAKAHAAEMGDVRGKQLKANAVQVSTANHAQMEIAIQAANDGLKASTSVRW
jgi:hypothetical protein